QLRTVRSDRSHPHADSVDLRTQLVYATARRLARDPRRAGDRNASVERDCELEDDERTLLRDPRAPRLVLCAAAKGQLAPLERNLYSGRAQTGDAVHLGIRVERADQHGGDARGAH